MPTPTVQSFAWRFGGPLADLPAHLAWTLLGVVTLGGLAWIVRGYLRTLVALPPRRRATLTALRALVWLTLMLALAGPTRVERTYANRQTRPLAILVDRSDSMTKPDNRGQRRLDDALRRWRQAATAAEAAFGRPQVFAFADDLAQADDPEAAPPLATNHTRLHHSIREVIDRAPPGGWGGVVLITDGLDTTGDTSDEALAATLGRAISAGVPLYPLAGRNRYSGDNFIHLRELTVPARVPPRSRFTLEVTLDAYQGKAREVPVRLRVGDDWRPAETLSLGAGRRALSWSGEIPAQAEGALPLELQIGDDDQRVTARAEVLVARPDVTRILYYQGALDWGYRFLANILRRDPAFQLTPVFDLAPIGATAAVKPPPGALARLPGTPAELDEYDVVVLANAAAEQLSPGEQKALGDWVKTGGVLLFLAPDDAAAQGYAGSELEQMLPVVFGQPAEPPPTNFVQSRFRERMRQLGGANGSEEQRFAELASARSERPELSTFAWEPAADAIFGGRETTSSPAFANYANVRGAKPGATVLARHPTALAPDGKERAILLAIQRYGGGQSAVFTSDALWRWKLRQPSEDRDVEKFWQDLFAWLGRERPRGPSFDHPPLTARVGEEIELKLRGAGANAPFLSVESGASANASLLSAAGDDHGAFRYRWTPPAAGEWRFTAADDKGRQIRHYLQVSDPRTVGEASGLPPDDGLLHTLAQRTGGMPLGDATPPAWSRDGRAAELLSERLEPLWHQGALLAAVLLAYAAELLLRRRWQLL